MFSQSKITVASFSLGLLLIAISIYPLFLMIRETIIASYIHSRYEVTQIFNLNKDDPKQADYTLNSPFVLEGNTIIVQTEDTQNIAPKTRFDKETKHIVKITIKINGEDVSFPTVAWLPSSDTKDSRFWSWLNVVRIRDIYNGTSIGIIQPLTGHYVPGESYKNFIASQKWRIIYLDKNKHVSEEIFAYPERGKHLLGVSLVQTSAQATAYTGYFSDILTYMPNLYFPYVYPVGSGIAGIVLTIAGLLKLRVKTV